MGIVGEVLVLILVEMMKVLPVVALLTLMTWTVASAQITLVQTTTGSNSNGTSVSATFSSTPTQNNLLVAIAGCRYNSSAPTTPSGWSVAISQFSVEPGQVIYYKIAGASESSTVTVSGYGTSSPLTLQIYEYSGITTSSPLDQTSSAYARDNAIYSGSITTTQANELIIVGSTVAKDVSWSSWTSSFTEQNDFGFGVGAGGIASAGADRIVSSTGSYSTTATLSGSDDYRAQIVSFKGIVTKTWDGGAGTNNWGDANNWDPNGVPTSANNVSLTGANTIDVNVAGACNDITLNNASLTLTVKSGNSLSVSRNLTLTAGTLNTEASFPSVTGTTTLSGGTVGYTASSGSQTVAARSYPSLTISGGGTKTLAGNATTSANLTVSGGTFDLSSYTCNRASSGGSLTVSNGATLKIGGTNTFPSNYTTIILGATSTVEYSSTSAQTIAAQNYGNLTISGSRTTNNVTLASSGTIGVAGTFTASATFTSGSYVITGSTVDFNGSGAQNVTVFNYNNLTLSNAGTKTFTAGTFGIAATFTISGSASADATTYSNTINYNGSGAQTVRAINYNNLTISGSRTTNNVTLASSGTIGISGTFTNSATFTSGGYVTTGSTVNYNGSGAQAVTAISYNNLTLSNSGIKTFGLGTSGIAGTFTISGSASADATTNSATINYNSSGAQTVRAMNYHHLTLSNAGTKSFASGTTGIAGTLTISGSATADATTNSTTIDYNGSGAQSIGATTYHHLMLSNAGTKTFPGTPVTINGNLSIGGTATGTAGAALTVNGNFSTVSGTTFNAGTYTHTFKGDYSVVGTGSYSTGTIVLSGTSAQNLTNANSFYNLTIDNANGVSLTGTTGANTTLTLTNGKVTSNGYDFTMGYGGAINGSSSSRYFVTNSTGKLLRYGVNTSGSLFPIGTTTAYLPVTVKTNDASGGGVSARVVGSVTPAFSADSAAVVATWILGYGAVQRQITEATFQWNQTNEGASLVRAYAVAQYNTGGGVWAPVGSTTIAGSNPYTATVTGLTQYGNYMVAEIPPTTYYSKGSYDVSSASNWNTARNASGTTPSLFGRGHTWTIQNTHNMTLSGSTAWDVSSSGTIQIESGGSWANSSSGTVTAGTFQVDNGGTYSLSGSATIPGTTRILGTTSTVDYAGTDQTVLALNYGNLTLSNSGTKTFAAGTTGIAGTFTSSGSPTADATTNSTTINYNGSGAQSLYSMTYHNLTFSNAGTKSFNYGSTAIRGAFTISGSATADATTNTPYVVYNGTSAQTVLAINYYNLNLSSNSLKTIAAGTIGIANEFNICCGQTAGNIDATTNTTTFDYNGNGAQTVVAINYRHLTLSNAGTKTFASGTTGIAGDLTISGSVAGDATTNATTINFNGSGAQSVAAMNYYNLTLSGSGVKRFAAGTTGIAAILLVSGATADATTNSTTINYNGSGAQTIEGINYHHLTVSGGNTKTPLGGLSIAGNLTIGASTTFSAQNHTHTIQGNFSNSGTFTAGSSTIQLTGSSDASITGATTFNVLEVNKNAASTTVTLNNNVSTPTLTMTQGKISTGANAITVTSSRTGNGLVIGTITRTHTFNASTAYAFEGPYQTLTFNSGGTLPTSVTVTTTLSNPGANNYMEPIDRYYTISQTGGSGFTYTLRLHYEDSEVSSPNSETSPPLKIWRRTSTSPDVWTREGATSNSTTNNWVEQTGLTNVGTFSLSSRTVADIVLTLSQSATNPSPGQQVTYTLSYANTGDGSSTNTLVTASAPVNTSYVASSVLLNGVAKTDASDADEVTVSGSTITINLGTIAVGGSGTVTYLVVVN